MPEKLGDLLYPLLPLLRSRRVRLLVVGIPAVTTMAAIITAVGPDPALGIVVSVVAGVIVSSSLFLAVSSLAQELATERVMLAQTVEEEHWHVRAQRLFPRHRKNGNLYADWYFRLRLEEEVERARRYNVPFSLLIAKKSGPTVRTRTTEWLNAHVEEQLRRTDLPAVLRDGSLGVILPHTARYHEVRQRLIEVLASADAHAGLAVFPKDGQDVASLLKAADVAASQDGALRVA